MRILLAIDASPDSKNAARMVRHFAEPPVLNVLNVVDEDALKHAYISPDIPAGYLDAYRIEVTEAAERVLHETKTELAGHCGHIRLIADTGDAAESIIQTAEETQAELIIVGQRGMTATPSCSAGSPRRSPPTRPARCSWSRTPRRCSSGSCWRWTGRRSHTKRCGSWPAVPSRGPST